MPAQLSIPPVVLAPAIRHSPRPGAVVAAVALVQQVLGLLALRHPASLSAAEADLQAFFAGGEEDLQSIRDRATLEMLETTTQAARDAVDETVEGEA